jgi:hypothetical protein
MAATQQKNATPKKKRRGLARWLTSFSGILASIATIVAAGASVLAAHQTSRVNQLTVVVKQQQQQIQQARHRTTSGSGSSGSPSNGGASGASGGALPSGGVYLSAMQPTVNNANLSTGSQTMSAKAYSDSSTFYCFGPQGGGQPDEAFDVAGHSLFKAEVGIPDDAANATSLDETVTFANQTGVQLIKPVVVSLGHPATVELNISGVAQLEVSCTGTNTQNQQQENSNMLTLGNAFVS